MPVFRKDGKSLLFIHVPKTGGSSIERMFANGGYTTLYRDPKIGSGSVNQLRRCSPQHMHAELLERIFKIESFDLVFMISREPVARFKSEYGMRSNTVQVDSRAVDEWAEKAFDRYCRDNFVYDNHLRPQAEFYVPGCLVYRLEDGMKSIVDDVNSRLDTTLDVNIPRVMERKQTSGVASGDVEVSSQLEERIKSFYGEDYERFGYPR